MNSLEGSFYSQTREWSAVINKTYHHNVYRLSHTLGKDQCFLDLVHVKHWMFGNSLVSMPFSDVGGFTGQSAELEPILVVKAMELAVSLSVDSIELRMDRLLPWLTPDYLGRATMELPCRDSQPLLEMKQQKVRMVLDLPDSPEALMAGFKSKLRSQIRRPMKGGMVFRIGRKELIDDFYRVFEINMRDLGSPIHSKHLFMNVMDEFKTSSNLVIIYSGSKPVAGAFIVGSGPILSNPWASSLKEYRSSSPNMLLYWAMLDFAVKKGYRRFDFGRSTPGEGTYEFKKQWGASQEALYWYVITMKKGRGGLPSKDEGAGMMGHMVRIWQRLPVPVATLMGPWVRKNISL